MLINYVDCKFLIGNRKIGVCKIGNLHNIKLMDCVKLEIYILPFVPR